MGCDIHLHIEVKISGKWEHWAAPTVSRYYPLFALMGNIRNSNGIKALSNKRGLPEDITEVTRFVSKCEAGHGHSWLNSEEISVLTDRIDKLARPEIRNYFCFEQEFLHSSWFLGNSFASFHKQTATYPKEIEDVRFVFWFDS